MKPKKYRYYLQIASLFLVGITGILGAIVGGIDRLAPGVNLNYGAIGIFMLGTICLSLLADRTYLNSRLEDEITSTLARINLLSSKAREVIKNVVNDYVTLQSLKSELPTTDEYFSRLSDEILKKQYKILTSLSQGNLLVPSEQTAIYQRHILNHYYKRFDAVSENDINFWINPSSVSNDYFKDLSRSLSRRGTLVNRIFIVTAQDLNSRFDELVEILKKHEKHRKGFGIAVSEELHPDFQNIDAPRDFALIDVDKAVSYFTNKSDPDGWWYKVSFATTKKNKENINKQKGVFVRLIAECWLVNSCFEMNFPELRSQNITYDNNNIKYNMNNIPELLTREDVDKILKLTKFSNDQLKKNMGEDFTPESDIFPLIGQKESEIATKLTKLKEIVHAYEETERVTPESRNPR